MNSIWQDIIAAGIVLAAVAYLVRSLVGMLRGRQGGCGTCGSCAADEPKKPQLVSLDPLEGPPAAIRPGAAPAALNGRGKGTQQLRPLFGSFLAPADPNPFAASDGGRQLRDWGNVAALVPLSTFEYGPPIIVGYCRKCGPIVYVAIMDVLAVSLAGDRSQHRHDPQPGRAAQRFDQPGPQGNVNP